MTVTHHLRYDFAVRLSISALVKLNTISRVTPGREDKLVRHSVSVNKRGIDPEWDGMDQIP